MPEPSADPLKGPANPTGAISPADDLFEAMAALRTAAEARRFLADLATPAEIVAFADRWRIARLLHQGAHSYRDIAAATGASTTTVARVARFLKDEPHGGYRLMIDRMGAAAAPNPRRPK